MSHARAAIREAVVAALVAADTAAAARVYDHPYRPRTTFPALVVEDAGSNLSESNVTEVQVPLQFDADVMQRRYRFVVIAEIQQSEDAARERDDLVAEVEVAIAAAVVAGVESIMPTAYVAGDDNTGSKPIRRGLQAFEAVYITPRGDPSTTL